MKGVAAVLGISLGLLAFGQDAREAERLYRHTDYDGALRLLREVRSPGFEVWMLMGKCNLMKGEFKKATEQFQKAVNLDPKSSDAMLWLGRSWARRAETASPLFAPANASRARTCFERAVALQANPRNHEAMDDLFDFYLDAPGFLGGGFDKAEALVGQIEIVDPAQGHYDLAEIARKRKEFDESEQELRRAVQLGPREIGHLMALARFLANRGRIEESEAVIAQAAAANPGNPRLLYGKARIYVETHRNLDEARSLLEQYLHSDLTPDDPSRDEARKLLRKAGA
ncbi:MAG TPA: tetratricopeptide repeat protein [Bryobacteraceae bacterium]|nr:tetratricopeptide repeat protein [Bryobacteraceae bacterium]